MPFPLAAGLAVFALLTVVLVVNALVHRFIDIRLMQVYQAIRDLSDPEQRRD